ncbi:MAG: glycosyltransferase family 4 protein [Solirubrobacterales bacterium]
MTVNSLPLGGTQKALQTHALELVRSGHEVRVVAVGEGGPRAKRLSDGGAEVVIADGNRHRLAEMLQGADVVHMYRDGIGERMAPAACRAAGIELLVESNIFGAVDVSPDEAQFSCHLLPSKFCALRYRWRTGIEMAPFHARHRVSYWPVDVDRIRGNAPPPDQAKRALGLDPTRPVVGRIGRADDRKWRNIIVDMVPHLLELVPEVQVAMVGATPAKLRRLERLGVLDRTRLFEPTADEAELAAMYAACDVFVTAAEIGESHSYAIEEAMTLGVPVVTCSTPWVDNAQIEQIDEGVTGHVANHPRAFAEAVASIVSDPERRRRLGEAGRRKAESLYDSKPLTEQLVRLYDSLLRDGSVPEEWSPDLEEVDAFEQEYERRLTAQYRTPTPKERREIEIDRIRERAAWAARAAISTANPKGMATIYWAARARLARARR